MRSSIVSLALLVCFSTGFSGKSLASKPASKIYQITAGFLLQFTSFVKWPAPRDGNLNLCLLGHDPFAGYIDEMVKISPTNRDGETIAIDRIMVGRSVGHCQIIFISKSSVEASFWQSLPDDHSILLVSDYYNFVKQGGLVSVYPKDKRMRLAVNLSSTKKAGLSISSQLLKLALIVDSEPSVEK